MWLATSIGMHAAGNNGTGRMLHLAIARKTCLVPSIPILHQVPDTQLWASAYSLRRMKAAHRLKTVAHDINDNPPITWTLSKHSSYTFDIKLPSGIRYSSLGNRTPVVYPISIVNQLPDTQLCASAHPFPSDDRSITQLSAMPILVNTTPSG